MSTHHDCVQKFVPSSDSDSDDGYHHRGAFTNASHHHEPFHFKPLPVDDSKDDSSSDHKPTPVVMPKNKRRQQQSFEPVSRAMKPALERQVSTGSGTSMTSDKLSCLFTIDRMAYDVVLDDLTLTMTLVDGQVRSE